MHLLDRHIVYRHVMPDCIDLTISDNKSCAQFKYACIHINKAAQQCITSALPPGSERKKSKPESEPTRCRLRHRAEQHRNTGGRGKQSTQDLSLRVWPTSPLRCCPRPCRPTAPASSWAFTFSRAGASDLCSHCRIKLRTHPR